MKKDIQSYNNSQEPSDKAICELLNKEIDAVLTEAESKIWHGHPVWFLEGNPVVGYDKLKDSVRLLFWSGQSLMKKICSQKARLRPLKFDIQTVTKSIEKICIAS